MVSTYALSVDGASSLLDNVWVKQCLHSTWDPATALCGHLAGTTDCTSALKWPSHLFLLLYPVLLNPFIARETRSLYLLGLLARLWSRDFWVLLLEVCVHCYHAMLHMLICWQGAVQTRGWTVGHQNLLTLSQVAGRQLVGDRARSGPVSASAADPSWSQITEPNYDKVGETRLLGSSRNPVIWPGQGRGQSQEWAAAIW